MGRGASISLRLLGRMNKDKDSFKCQFMKSSLNFLSELVDKEKPSLNMDCNVHFLE